MMCTFIIGRAQQIAVGTDLLMDAVLSPSLNVELTMTKKSTLNIEGMLGKNLFGTDMRTEAFIPEWRVYMSGRPMYHHYLGFVGILTSYKMKYADVWHDGDASGLGLSFGYVLPITQRLSVDFHSSLGALFYHQKEYRDTGREDYDYDSSHLNPDGYPEANANGTKLIPIKLGITMSYILK